MLVRNIHDRILPRLAVVDHRSSISAAAAALCAPGIGLIVVCNAAGNAEGVLSRSDLMRHLTTARSWGASLRDLMSRSIVSCTPEDNLRVVWQTMTDHGLQNVPVLAAGTRPVGILDIRDAMHALFEQEERLETMLADYVAGVGYR